MIYNLLVKNNHIFYISSPFATALELNPAEVADFYTLCRKRNIEYITDKNSGIIELRNGQYLYSKQAIKFGDDYIDLYNFEPLDDDLVLFFSIIIHELKNPLSAILGLIQAMEAKAERAAKNFIITDYTERIKGELKRLNSLLFSAKYIAKPRSSFYTKYDLIETINQTIKLFETEFAERNITVEVKMNTDKFIQNGNKDHIFQMMANIYKNSIEALKNKKSAKIEIVLDKKKDKVLLSVKDNGTGMNEDQLQQVKRAFSTTKKEGMGLGLYIVDRLVRIYNGTIDIKSDSKIGTTITIIFPIEHPENPY